MEPVTSPSLRAPGALISAAWKSFNQHFPTLVGIAAIGTLPSVLFNLPFKSDTTMNGSDAVLALLGGLISILLTMWMSCAIYYYLTQRPATRHPLAIYRLSISFVRKFFTTGLLQGLLLFLLGLAIFIPIITAFGVSLASVFADGRANLEPEKILTVLSALLVAGILALIPLTILGIRWQFSGLVVITEGRANWAAMRRSSALVRGRWWSVFWRFFVLGLMLGAFVIISQILLNLLGTSAIRTIVETLLYSLILGPLVACFEVEIFTDLRASRPTPVVS